jgi:hypothetical protein
MKVNVTAKFYLDNGEVKQVDWELVDPKIIVGSASHSEPLASAEAVQSHYMDIFRRMHKAEDVFVVREVDGVSTGVTFRKVSDWMIKVEVVTNEDICNE